MKGGYSDFLYPTLCDPIDGKNTGVGCCLFSFGLPSFSFYNVPIITVMRHDFSFRAVLSPDFANGQVNWSFSSAQISQSIFLSVDTMLCYSSALFFLFLFSLYFLLLSPFLLPSSLLLSLSHCIKTNCTHPLGDSLPFSLP